MYACICVFWFFLDLLLLARNNGREMLYVGGRDGCGCVFTSRQYFAVGEVMKRVSFVADRCLTFFELLLQHLEEKMNANDRMEWKEARDLDKMVPVHGVMTMLRYMVGTLRLEGSSTSRVPSTGVSSVVKSAATHDVPLGAPSHLTSWRSTMEVSQFAGLRFLVASLHAFRFHLSRVPSSRDGHLHRMVAHSGLSPCASGVPTLPNASLGAPLMGTRACLRTLRWEVGG